MIFPQRSWRMNVTELRETNCVDSNQQLNIFLLVGQEHLRLYRLPSCCLEVSRLVRERKFWSVLRSLKKAYGFPPGCEIAECNAVYVDYGKVESNRLHAEYVGAEIISNNTAELTAMVQCLFWILSILQGKFSPTPSGFWHRTIAILSTLGVRALVGASKYTRIQNTFVGFYLENFPPKKTLSSVNTYYKSGSKLSP